MMPLYRFVDKETGEVETHILKLDEREGFLKKNPRLKQEISVPGVISQRGDTLSKTSSDWRDRLKQIKKNAGRGNTIKTY